MRCHGNHVGADAVGKVYDTFFFGVVVINVQREVGELKLLREQRHFFFSQPVIDEHSGRIDPDDVYLTVVYLLKLSHHFRKWKLILS